METPLIRVKQLAYVRVEATDSICREIFAGVRLASGERTDEQTYFRGTDAATPCYILSKGQGIVTTIGFEAESLEDLQTLSELPEASEIYSPNERYGGKIVRLTDPVGMSIEVAYDRETLDSIEAAPSHLFNMNGEQRRVGELPGVAYGPSKVKRLGHLVLESADPESSLIGTAAISASLNPMLLCYPMVRHK